MKDAGTAMITRLGTQGVELPLCLASGLIFLMLVGRVMRNAPVVRACLVLSPTANAFSYLFVFPLCVLVVGLLLSGVIEFKREEQVALLAFAVVMGGLLVAVSMRNIFVCSNTNKSIRSAVDHRGLHWHYDILDHTRKIFQRVMNDLQPLSSCQNIKSGASGICTGFVSPDKFSCEYRQLRVVDLQIAGSYNTANVGGVHSGYGSSKMVSVALLGGARYLHFPVTTAIINNKPAPVVQFTHNFVPLYECLYELHQDINIRALYPYKKDAHLCDPIFIHIELNTQTQLGVMDQIAKNIHNLFEDRLLGPNHGYRYANVPELLVCNLFDKIVVIVSGDETRGTALDELINIRVGGGSPSDAKLYDWSDVNSSFSVPAMSRKTRGTFCIVHNKYDNEDPTELVRMGCQVVGMNYAVVDPYLIAYLEFFKTCSFLTKRSDMQPEG